jgi:hypothetical protein
MGHEGAEMTKDEEEVTADDADDVIPQPRPQYPDDTWKGTAYGIFADICTRDNHIPKKFFSEGCRTVSGACMGGSNK